MRAHKEETKHPVRAAHNNHKRPKEKEARSIVDDPWRYSSIAKREGEQNVPSPSFSHTSLSTFLSPTTQPMILWGWGERDVWGGEWALQWLALASPREEARGRIISFLLMSSTSWGCHHSAPLFLFFPLSSHGCSRCRQPHILHYRSDTRANPPPSF